MEGTSVGEMIFARFGWKIDESSVTGIKDHLKRIDETADRTGERISQSFGQRVRKAFDSCLDGALKFMHGLSTLGLGLFGLDRLAAAAGALAQQIGNLAQTAGEMGPLRESFRNLAADAGKSAETVLRSMREAARGMISDSELMRNANQAFLLIGKDIADYFPRMIQIAQAAAKATKQDVTFMLDSIVRGVGRASPLILDNLGLNLKLSEAYEKLARSLGKSVNQLTKEEQTQALLKEVMRAGSEMVERMGQSIGGLDEKLAAARVSIQNARDALMASLAPALTEVFNRLTPLIQDTTDRLIPAFEKLGIWLVDKGIPALFKGAQAVGTLAQMIRENLIPILAGLTTALWSVAIPALISWAANALHCAKTLEAVALAAKAAATTTISSWLAVLGPIALVTAAVWALVNAYKAAQEWEARITRALDDIQYSAGRTAQTYQEFVSAIVNSSAVMQRMTFEQQRYYSTLNDTQKAQYLLKMGIMDVDAAWRMHLATLDTAAQKKQIMAQVTQSLAVHEKQLADVQVGVSSAITTAMAQSEAAVVSLSEEAQKALATFANSIADAEQKATWAAQDAGMQRAALERAYQEQRQALLETGNEAAVKALDERYEKERQAQEKAEQQALLTQKKNQIEQLRSQADHLKQVIENELKARGILFNLTKQNLVDRLGLEKQYADLVVIITNAVEQHKRDAVRMTGEQYKAAEQALRDWIDKVISDFVGLGSALADYQRQLEDFAKGTVQGWTPPDLGKEAERAAEGIRDTGQTVVQALQDTLNNIASSVKAWREAAQQVVGYVPIAFEQGLEWLLEDVVKAVELFERARVQAEGAAGRAGRFAENVGKIADAVTKWAEMSRKAADYSTLARAKLDQIATDIRAALDVFLQKLRQIDEEELNRLLSGEAGLGAIVKMIEGLGTLLSVKPETVVGPTWANDLIRVVGYIDFALKTFTQRLSDVTVQNKERLQRVQEAFAPVAEMLGSINVLLGITGETVVSPTFGNDLIRVIGYINFTLDTFVKRLIDVAEEQKERIKRAGEAWGPVASMIGNIAPLLGITGETVVSPTFANDLIRVVGYINTALTIFVQRLTDVAEEKKESMKRVAEAYSAVTGIIRDALGLKDLEEYESPAGEILSQIADDVKNALERFIAKLGNYLKENPLAATGAAFSNVAGMIRDIASFSEVTKKYERPDYGVFDTIAEDVKQALTRFIAKLADFVEENPFGPTAEAFSRVAGMIRDVAAFKDLETYKSPQYSIFDRIAQDVRIALERFRAVLTAAAQEGEFADVQAAFARVASIIRDAFALQEVEKWVAPGLQTLDMMIEDVKTAIRQFERGFTGFEFNLDILASIAAAISYLRQVYDQGSELLNWVKAYRGWNREAVTEWTRDFIMALGALFEQFANLEPAQFGGLLPEPVLLTAGGVAGRLWGRGFREAAEEYLVATNFLSAREDWLYQSGIWAGQVWGHGFAVGAAGTMAGVVPSGVGGTPSRQQTVAEIKKQLGAEVQKQYAAGIRMTSAVRRL